MRRIAILAVLFAATVDAQTIPIRADSADTLKIGPFFDATDLAAGTLTPDTGLTIADGDVLIAQPGGGNLAEETGVEDCAHEAAGVYECAYDASVFDTEGAVLIVVNVAGVAPWRQWYDVQAADYYDLSHIFGSLVSSDVFGVDLDTAIDSVTSQTVFELVAGPDNDDYCLGCTVHLIDAAGDNRDVALVADYDFNVTGPVYTLTINSAPSFTVQVGDTLRVHAFGNTNLELVEGVDATDTLGVAQTGDSFARLGAPVGASIAADLATADGNIDDIETYLNALLDGTASMLGCTFTISATSPHISVDACTPP